MTEFIEGVLIAAGMTATFLLLMLAIYAAVWFIARLVGHE